MEAIVQASNTSIFHRHKWTPIKTIGSAEYFQCHNCGAKKVIYPTFTGSAVRWGWMSGAKTTLKQSPVRKDADNG